MYELHPHFTNDGTVGLYSPQDNDIYHSTYGALTESWEKFVVPAHFREYLAEHDEVKILDICYGIGYNTKTALNVFLQEVEKKENSKKKFHKLNKKNLEKKIKMSPQPNDDIAAIHTDNISSSNFTENYKNNENFYKNEKSANACNAQLDTDNVSQGRKPHSSTFCEKLKLLHKRAISLNIFQHIRSKQTCNLELNSERYESENKILIDAVDTDGVLMGLSPFIVNGLKSKAKLHKEIYKNNFDFDAVEPEQKCHKNKLYQIHKMQKTQMNQNRFLKAEYKIKDEVSIILLQNLLDKNPELVNNEILQQILAENKYSSFLSKFMINLAQFYSNWGSYCTCKKNRTGFLHNIYYQYLSRSNKRAQKLQFLANIDLNLHATDARAFIIPSTSNYNFIFLDAFTPSKCPALWSLEFFKVLYSKLSEDGMILTYSNSAAVRNAFIKSGFYVGKIYNEQTKKFTGTVAVKNKQSIEHDLNEQDWDLINSKAGICYRDENLDSNNADITANRNIELSLSNLSSSSKVIKEYKRKKL